MSKQPIRGTRDLMGIEHLRHLELAEIARKSALDYGYHSIETPIFESTSVFQKSLGDTSDVVGKEMYTFLDRGGESITLRPEGTAAVVRAFLHAGLTQTLPQKFFYSGPMFRYERPQKGRYRQFYQIGVECLGYDDPYIDVECIALAHNLLKTLGIETTLYLNTLGDASDRIIYRDSLINFLTPYVHELSQESQVRLLQNPLRILDSKNAQDQKICESAPQMILSKASHAFFETVCKNLQALQISFEHDTKLVRGLDYYAHTAFEFKSTSLGAQDTVLGGGRYNDLVAQMGGPHVPGIGWAMGIDRAALLADHTYGHSKKLCIAVVPVGEEQKQEALLLTQTLRKENLYVELITAYNDLGKRLKTAHRLKAEWVIILGEDELKENKIQLKYFGENTDIQKMQIITKDELLNIIR